MGVSSGKNPDGIRKKVPEAVSRSELKPKQDKVLPVGKNIAEAKPGTFMDKYASARREEPEQGIIITDISSLENELGGEESKKLFTRPLRWWALGSIVAMVILVFLVSTVFARLTVTLKPKLENMVLKDVSVTLDSSVPKVLSAERVIPAERLEFVRSAAEEFDATGQKFIEEKARGKVQIYNSYSSSPQTLVENTRFITDSGILYRLTKNTLIPGAKVGEGKIIPKFVEVELAADRAGEEANFEGEVNLKIPGFKGSPKYSGFYASSLSGFSGGFRGDTRVVSKSDLVKAEEFVTKKAYSEVKEEIARKIPPEFSLIDALREVEITKIDIPRENTRRDRFSAEAKAVGKVIVFRGEDIKEFLKAAVLKDDKTKELISDTVSVRQQIRSVDFSKGKADVSLQGEIKVKSVIPEGEFASLISGKKEGSIIELLKQRPELSAFRLAFFPPWRFSSPQEIEKIKFVIENP